MRKSTFYVARKLPHENHNLVQVGSGKDGLKPLQTVLPKVDQWRRAINEQCHAFQLLLQEQDDKKSRLKFAAKNSNQKQSAVCFGLEKQANSNLHKLNSHWDQRCKRVLLEFQGNFGGSKYCWIEIRIIEQTVYSLLHQ